MKISSINYSLKNSKKQNLSSKQRVNKCAPLKPISVLNHDTTSFTSKNLGQSLTEVYLERSVYENWISKLSPNCKKIGESVASYNLGIELGQKLCQKFTSSQIDFTASIAKLRDKMLGRNFEFSLSVNWLTENKNLNAVNYILEHYDNILTAIKHLGVDSVIYGLEMKQQRFEVFINDVDRYVSFAPNSHIEMLTELTNPTMTEHYRFLKKSKNMIQANMREEEGEEFSSFHSENKRKLNILKALLREKKSEQDSKYVKKIYQQISQIRREEIEAKSFKIKELEATMSNIKADMNKCLARALKDPQKKIELFYMYKNLPNRDDICQLNQMFLSDKFGDSTNVLNEFLLEKLADVYELTPIEHSLLKSLKLEESPHFTRLFQAAPPKEDFAYGREMHTLYLQKGFYDNFKKMLTIVSQSLEFKEFQKGEMKIEECLQKVFSRLPQNIKTKELFEAHNLDFDAWSTYNPERDCIKIDNRTMIRKVNMNNLKHSLFLGNQACCCTAVGTGSRASSAASYPMNQFVQAIELLVDDTVIGNTMCYLASVEAKSFSRMITDDIGELEIIKNPKKCKLALILDNMEVLKPYRYDEKYLEMFIKYAHKLIADIGGISDIAIYTGHRNSFDMQDYKNNKETLSGLLLLGESERQTLSLDSIANLSVINDTISSNKNYYGQFYCIKP